MIYRQQQIEKYLKKPEPGIKVFVVYGTNEGLQTEYVRSLTQTVCQDIFDPFQVVYFNASDINADSSALMAEYASQSLLGGRRVIVIKDADNNLTKHIKTMLDTINSDTLVIMSSDSLNRKSSLVSTGESRDDMAVIACYEDRDEDIYSTVKSTLVNNGFTISNEALQVLCARLSSDRKSNLGELDKLITFMGTKRDISIEDISSVIADVSTSNVEDVCYYAVGGDNEKTQKAYIKMLNEGDDPISLVRSLSYHFSKILTAISHMENGDTLDKAVAKLRIIFLRESAFKRQVSIWKRDRVLGALEYLHNCEKDCKTTNMPAQEVVGYALLTISSAASKLAKG